MSTNERPTPETDTAILEASQYYQPLYPSVNGRNQPVHAHFARRLEQQRDDYHKKAIQIADERDRYKEQRDELLEALKVALEHMERYGLSSNGPCMIARAAIDSVEKGSK